MTVTANSSGLVAGNFTVPAGIPSGKKLVEFIGANGSYGTAIFTSEHTREITNVATETTKQLITYVPLSPPAAPSPVQRVDPLAQTFIVSETLQATSVDLWFTAKGTSNVLVQIRNVIAGVPGETVIAQAIKPVASINTTGSTKISFDYPVLLYPDTEYALVVLCGDAVAALSVAELGKFDASTGKWVTNQAYAVGVLLSSSNASTWTPHQEKDLTFRINRAVYTETTKTVNLGNVAVTGATDLLLLAQVELPTPNCYVTWALTLPDTSVVPVIEGQAIKLAAAITGNVGIVATLHGETNAAPVLLPGTQLLTGVIGSTGTYVSRAVLGGAGVRIKVIIDVDAPGASSVTVAYKGIDGGDTWADMSLASSGLADNGFVEKIYETSGITETMIQIRLTLAGSAAARPTVRNFRYLVMAS